MYLLLFLAQNLPTELQVCPHPQTHRVGVFWGQIPGGLAVSQVKILLEKRVVLEDIPLDDTMISSLALCEKEQMPIMFIKMKTSMQPMVLRMNTNYTMPWT